MINNFKEIIRYGIAGVINTFVGYGVFLFLIYFIAINPYYANAISYFIALCVAFILNKLFVFKMANNSIKFIFKFIVSFFIAYAINLIILYISLSIFNLNYEIGQMLAMIVYTISFYILNKFIVFTKLEVHNND